MWQAIECGEKMLGLFSFVLKVPGGWIVRSVYNADGKGAAITQTFVSDPQHKHKW